MISLVSRLHRGIASGAVVLLLGVTGTGCLGIEGSGVLRSQERSVLAFHAIDVSGSLDLDVVQGSPQRVEVSTDDNLLPLLRTEVHDGTLTIDMRSFVDPTAIRVHVTAPVLDAVSLSGSADVQIKQFTGQNFRLETSGSGNVTFDAMNLTGTLVIDASGSSDIRAKGEARALTIGTSGSSSIDTRAFAAGYVAIDSSGSSDIMVFAKDSLTIDLSGSASVGYLGDPKVGASVSGSGEIQHL